MIHYEISSRQWVYNEFQFGKNTEYRQSRLDLPHPFFIYCEELPPLTWMPAGRHMACPRMLKIVSLSSSLVPDGSSSSISFFSAGRRGTPSPWLQTQATAKSESISLAVSFTCTGHKNELKLRLSLFHEFTDSRDIQIQDRILIVVRGDRDEKREVGEPAQALRKY